MNKLTSLKELCFASLKEFSHTALRFNGGTIGRSGEIKPLEAQYRDEFYRARYVKLGQVYLTSEWAGKKLGGRVDFHIKQIRWSIECAREGDRLNEHVAGFRPGGRYHKWIKGEGKDG